jgi:large subunit ribosomal protein L31e
MAEKTVEEKIFTVPLGDAYKAPRPVRARKAMNYLKDYLKRHLKDEVAIGPGLNHEIWSRGIKKPPKRVKIVVKKDEDKFRAELFGYKPKVVEEKKKPEKKKKLKDAAKEKLQEKKTDKPKKEEKKSAKEEKVEESKKEEPKADEEWDKGEE